MSVSYLIGGTCGACVKIMPRVCVFYNACIALAMHAMIKIACVHDFRHGEFGTVVYKSVWLQYPHSLNAHYNASVVY